jgi:hypothetical protein
MGFNSGSPTCRPRSASPRSKRLEELLNARDNVAALYRERLTQLVAAPPARTRTTTSSSRARTTAMSDAVVRLVVQLPKKTDRDAVISSLGDQGIASKAYLPCIHLLPRTETGSALWAVNCPIAERVSERSLALPFFTSMTEGQVDRVCTGLAEALGKPTLDSGPMSRFGEEQDPLFRRINSSISFDWRLASFDIEQSKAHARALAKLGVLNDTELAQITEGLDGSAMSSTRRTSSSASRTRTSTWRSSGASPS